MTAPLDLARRCAEAIAAARAAVDEDALVDLAGLDADIAEVTRALAGIAAPERGVGSDLLEEIAAGLDGLAEALGAQQRRLAESDDARRVRAMDAYQRAGTGRP